MKERKLEKKEGGNKRLVTKERKGKVREANGGRKGGREGGREGSEEGPYHNKVGVSVFDGAHC